jgi:NitT/TauT family transport system substrate-binding protein
MRRLAWLLAVGIALAAAVPGMAQESARVRYGYSGGADTAAAWIAQDAGIFQRHGLDVTLTQVANSALFPAALQSGSLDVAAPTAPLVLQAVAGGLDLVVVSGGSVVPHDEAPGASGMVVLARPALKAATVADFAGRKVGVPGLGGFADLLFRDWLRRGGKTSDGIAFVELGQGAMVDALRTGSVDAVVATDPAATRIRQSGAGTVAGDLVQGLPEGMAVIVYAATRDWATQHRAAATAFAQAIAEATEKAKADPTLLRTTIGRWLKVPPEVMQAASLPVLRTSVDATALGAWVPMMKAQGEGAGDPAVPLHW